MSGSLLTFLGSDRNVYLMLNDTICVARVPLDYNFDNNIDLKLNINDMYFFDKDTGENLLYKKR